MPPSDLDLRTVMTPYPRIFPFFCKNFENHDPTFTIWQFAAGVGCSGA